jgi:PAS domain S-box-containing protein
VLAAIAVPLTVRSALESQLLPFVFAVAVLVAAAFAGKGAGVLATIAGTAATAYVTGWLAPGPSYNNETAFYASLLVFATGAAITLVVGALHSGIIRAQERESELHESEARLRLSMAASNIGLWSVDLQPGLTTRFESLAAVLTIQTAAQGDAIDARSGTIHPEDRTSVAEAFAAALAGRHDFDCAYRIVGADGRCEWVASHGCLLNSANSDAIALVGTSRNITLERKCVHDLRDSEAFFRTALEAARIGIARVDANGSFVEANDQLSAITGYQHDELLKRNVRDIIHSQDDGAEGNVQELAGAAVGGPEWVEKCGVRKDGSVFRARWAGRAVRDNDRPPFHYVVVVQEASACRNNDDESGARERLLSGILESIPIGISLTDAKGRLLLQNRAVRCIWGNGLAAADSISRTPFSRETAAAVSPEGSPGALVTTAGRTSAGRVIDVEISAGETRKIWRSATPVRYDHAGVTGTILVDQDVTLWNVPECSQCGIMERFRLAQTAVGLASWEWEVPSNTLKWADNTRIFGIPSETIGTFQDWERLVHSQDVSRVRTALENAIADQRPLEVEYRIVRPDGEVRWVSAMGKALRGADGQPVRMIGIANDITHVKRARQDAEVLAALVESSDDAIIRETVDGIVETWSCGAQQMFGYSAQEMIGCPVTTLEAAADATETLDVLSRVAKGHRVKHLERIRYRSDGQQIWVSLTLCPIRNDAGKIIGISEVARDISANKGAEKRIQSLNRDLERRVRARTTQLEDANQMLESFVYTASHDLRAPLRTIQGLTQALLEDCADLLDENGKEYARCIVEGTTRMDRLIRDLLEYSRLNRRELKIQEVPLRTAVDEALREQTSAIRESGAEVHVAEIPMAVLAHELTLVQVVGNLISNAVKFVRPGVRPIVQISAETRERRVRLCVEDNGIGIEPNHLTRIFDLFERLHVAGEYPGTGIGLAIVRKGIERLSGKVGVESVLKSGSRFWIELPCAHCDKPAK